uniref:Related to PRP43-spliceosomal RNA helicase (DEAH-box family) n=1 Tax=Melanopsichium pennsylvanicum 4 TaxID=1398559 RepID=A0A077R2S8_9BASI|nr:related to PRP43-spliceosomal RNA helicase (DEAH-box family) [Melanopsichium pennsylvanicum 4]
MASNTAFWKPGTSRPASALDRTSEAESSSTSIIPPTSLQSCSIFAASSSFSQRLRILHTVQTHQVTLIISESGADIINFLPQILHNAAWTSNGNIIAFTSPRRSTTISKANQLANSMGISLGQQVGYTVAFETNTSTSTIIHCVTDEIMFRELLRDPLLTRYSIVMVGEADHRAVYSDLLLALLNNILRNRPDLRVIISCASPRASQVFKQFFQHDPTLPPCSNQTSETSQTSQHTVSILDLRSPSLPVHIAYLQNPCPDYIKATVDTILSIHQSCPLGGHILAYLPTTVHINSALQELSDYQSDYPSSAPRMHLLPLHSALSAAEQAQVFSITAAGERKVIITTDAANALALEEIVYIIDSGLSRIRMIDPKSGIESFAIAPISQDIAIQRAAIARSRTTSSSSGKCLRLYTEPFFLHQMMPSTPPELNRVDITTPVLLLKALGIDNLIKFDYVPPSPPPQILARALKRLYQLCAIDDQTRLTATGTLMAELPLPAQWGRILLASAQHNQVAEERKGTGTGTGNANANANANEWGIGSCAQEILTIISMLQVQHPFYAPHTVETQLAIRNFTATEGDLFTLLNGT